MGERDTAVPRLNGYGKLTAGSLIAGLAALVLGDSSSFAIWFGGLAVVVLAVAMYRSPDDEDDEDENDRRREDETDSGTERVRSKESVEEFDL
ncbi:hypothetical protein C483_06385 [Natrialba hulunbeirensis JCM 10989]|uniref:Uncharacterized protein n=1 Tax=Natrialba hulunbeirensis JCM 10989 TaxID=1227493 RepID=M0A4V4_9EURY|nr:hypothetical protein [Natrialba hulunbeirensis]ELY92937.1 hypothetical protein C483_06385 [Natrialba hulunbeirensis JCM 10989]